MQNYMNDENVANRKQSRCLKKLSGSHDVSIIGEKFLFKLYDEDNKGGHLGSWALPFTLA